MKGRSDTYIIIPVYNEATVVGGVIRDVKKHFKHVVCVDDGSHDNSSLEIVKAGGILVRHPINLGQGAALQTGIEYAIHDPNAKYFVTYDADGQHQLEDVHAMLKVLENEKVDIVIGSRFLGKEAENMSGLKKVLLKMAVKFTNRTSGLQLTDAHNGLRAFNRHVAERMNITMPDFAHASEIIDRIAQEKFSYKEVAVTIVYTDYSRAKGQSVFNAINIGFDVLINRIIGK